MVAACQHIGADVGKVVSWVEARDGRVIGDNALSPQHRPSAPSSDLTPMVPLEPHLRAKVWQLVIEHRHQLATAEELVRAEQRAQLRMAGNARILRNDVLKACRSLLPAVDYLAVGGGMAAAPATTLAAISPQCPAEVAMAGKSPLTLGRRRIVPPAKDDYVTECVVGALRLKDYASIDLTQAERRAESRVGGGGATAAAVSPSPPLDGRPTPILLDDGSGHFELMQHSGRDVTYYVRQPAKTLLSLLRDHPLPAQEQRQLHKRLLLQQRALGEM